MPHPQPFGSVCEIEAGDTLTSHEAKPGLRWMVLQRHGKRPLAVRARILLVADNRCASLPWWSEIIMLETAASRFAACVCHTPPADEGAAWCDSWLCATPDAVLVAFQAHDPLCALPPDVAADGTAGRFIGAWSDLLASVFGLSTDQRTATRQTAA